MYSTRHGNAVRSLPLLRVDCCVERRTRPLHITYLPDGVEAEQRGRLARQFDAVVREVEDLCDEEVRRVSV